MNRSTAIAVAALAVALSACNASDTNRTTSTPPHVDKSTLLQPSIDGPSAPPAPPERGPVPANANAAAPGTNASVAFAHESLPKTTLPPSKGGSPEAQHVQVQAQDAAAKAPDTASADAAKRSVLERSAGASAGSAGHTSG